MPKANIVGKIKKEGIGIMPTDTMYGMVGSAFSIRAVNRIYKTRKRNLKKPLIILISRISDLDLFGVSYDKKILSKIWPDKVSIILPISKTDKIEELSYLHRGTKKLAFRIPKKQNLLNLLKKTGPLVAPSANPEGLNPANNISEAKKYFDNKVDFYVSGKVNKKSSTLIEFVRGGIKLIREGEVSVDRLRKKILLK